MKRQYGSFNPYVIISRIVLQSIRECRACDECQCQNRRKARLFRVAAQARASKSFVYILANRCPGLSSICQHPLLSASVSTLSLVTKL